MLNDTTLLSVSARLAKRLVSFAEAYGHPQEKGIQITIHLPQDDLAMLISTTRQTINKRLADWQRLGWIEVRYGKIIILNMEALQQLYRDE
jgi:CRP-like cAMP-binding protein